MSSRSLALAALLLALSARPALAQVTFTDVSASAGILPYAMQSGFGGGVAAEDFDQDGDVDLFVPQRFGQPNRLYRNLGNGTYEEIAAAAGLADTQTTRLGLWLDYDGDQRLDLLTIGDCYGTSAAFCSTVRNQALPAVSTRCSSTSRRRPGSKARSRPRRRDTSAAPRPATSTATATSISSSRNGVRSGTPIRSRHESS